ncbi:hypothetical protein BDR07DRAFT_1533977, partial [Suillus spraguei]
VAAETKLAKEAWHKACQIKGVNVKLTLSAVNMLSKCTSHMQGELKTKMCSLTGSFYGFQASNSMEVIRKNRDLAESLKSSLAFVFKDWSLKLGIYKIELLQEGINLMWFMNRTDEGIVYHKYFNPMPVILAAGGNWMLQCSFNQASLTAIGDRNGAGRESKVEALIG